MRYLLIVSVLSLLASSVFGQVSQGGKPLEVPEMRKKISLNRLIVLPKQDNEKLLKASKLRSEENTLKPFRFAQSVSVNITPDNSGQWFEVDDYRVWKVEIQSEGAKSLNLIFDNYYLPEGARLFIYSADKRDQIGAFTSFNNKARKILPTSPVAGDHLVVQYEEPKKASFPGELSIGTVNHDFVGIKSFRNERRPLGPSGSCNVNVNCDVASFHRREADAVVRILINDELCTGTLVNNTHNDATPYVYTANHCIENQDEADHSIFLFNYESPYCGEIDGDASRTLSGSTLRAHADSLDFSLVEMSVDPPAIYRPYFLGWDRSNRLPESSVCIHHPLGDVKKIAMDIHSPKIKSYRSEFMSNGFYLIGNWEEGTTEGGSSGGPLINQDGHLVGSLSGGHADCQLSVNDYFARFNLAWDHYSAQANSLKHWLDPVGTGDEILESLSPYSGPLLCGAFTNFTDEDEHALLKIEENGESKGFWSGNNEYGFSGFAEKFELDSTCTVAGVSLGVARASVANAGSQSKIWIQVYSGSFFPMELLYEQAFNLRNIEEGVMNYFEFNKAVETSGKFFISYSLDLDTPDDLFAAYLAKRNVEPRNTFFIKDDEEWYTFQQKTNGLEGSALLLEAVLCNVDPEAQGNDLKSEKVPVRAFPNPLSQGDRLYLKFDDEVYPDKVEIFDLIGRRTPVHFEQLDDRWIQLDFAGNRPGTYLIRVLDHSKNYQTKILYLGK